MRYERDGFSIEAAKKKRRPLPEWYLEQPPQPRGAALFWDAFRDLMTCRNGDGPIPWTAAMAYADRKGLAPDLANALWTVVRMADNTERRWRYDELKREAEGGRISDRSNAGPSGGDGR